MTPVAMTTVAITPVAMTLIYIYIIIINIYTTVTVPLSSGAIAVSEVFVNPVESEIRRLLDMATTAEDNRKALDLASSYFSITHVLFLIFFFYFFF